MACNAFASSDSNTSKRQSKVWEAKSHNVAKYQTEICFFLTRTSWPEQSMCPTFSCTIYWTIVCILNSLPFCRVLWAFKQCSGLNLNNLSLAVSEVHLWDYLDSICCVISGDLSVGGCVHDTNWVPNKDSNHGGHGHWTLPSEMLCCHHQYWVSMIPKLENIL